MLRFTLILAGVIACVMGMLNVLRIGQARSLVKRNRSLATITQAVQLSPHDPDVYLARAALLAKRGEFGLAVDDLRQAIALRPRDYKTWDELGEVLAKKGDTNAALVALSEARSLAPFYFGVRWDTALLLQKLGRHEEAFREFRVATLTLPGLLTLVIENAWETYAGNCEEVQRAVDPRTTQEQLALARFFINKDRAVEAMNLVRLIGDLSGDERRQLVGDFLQAKLFAEAHEVWAGEKADSPFNRTVGIIEDGGFESARLSDELGFTWVVEDELPGVGISLDHENAHSGRSSLRVNWTGTPDPSDDVISQLVLVEPNTRYELNFAVRAQDLITGGAPVVNIVDVSEADNRKLAQSSALPLGNSGWQNFSVGFATTTSTRAVRIALQRQSCSDRPCPIFGSLWLDDFGLSQNRER
ncbi:MAG: tetratricopeptide repeat protein [Pyrinomonadaceae bacterium]